MPTDDFDEFEQYDEQDEVEVEVIEPETVDELAAARALIAKAEKPKGNRAQRRAKPSPARENEATSDGVLFEFKGVDYTGPLAGRTKGLVDAVDEKSAGRMVRAILGDAQYRVFRDTDPYDSEYMELFEAWTKAAGFETPGN